MGRKSEIGVESLFLLCILRGTSDTEQLHIVNYRDLNSATSWEENQNLMYQVVRALDVFLGFGL